MHLKPTFLRFALILIGCVGFLALNQTLNRTSPRPRNQRYVELVHLQQQPQSETNPNRSSVQVTIAEVIGQQSLALRRELDPFPTFRNSGKLEDYQLVYNGRPLRSLVLTTWRSGSTFLGDVLNSLPGNFYHYEPLLNYGIKRIREVSGSGSTALVRLKKLLECDYEDMEDYIEYGKNHCNLFTHNHRLWSQCEQYPKFCFNSTFLSSYCKLFPFQSMKIVRVGLRIGRALLEDERLNVKILLLVRDPRGTLQSRKHRDWCPGIDDCDNAKVLCDDLVDDYILAVQLRKDFPERFRAIRYEDLSLAPYENVRALFEFFGRPLHADVVRFLDTHTKANAGGVSSTFRDSKSAPFHWKLDLTHSEVAAVQAECGRAMALWGYARAANDSHQREFDPLGEYRLDPGL